MPAPQRVDDHARELELRHVLVVRAHVDRSWRKRAMSDGRRSRGNAEDVHRDVLVVEE